MRRSVFALVSLLMVTTAMAPGQAVNASTPAVELKYAKQMQPFAPWMVGEWDVAGRFEPSPLFAKGGKETGRLISKLGPNGASVVFEYAGQGPAGTVKGQGGITFDAAKNQYLLSWCDATGCGPAGVGEWNYDYIIFTGEREVAGQKIELKWMFGNIATGSYSVNVALTDDNGSVKPVGVVTYRRPDAPKSRRPATAQGN
jgi:hypothetical protein